ncbi:MAG: acyltransferase, partial [Comamonadaceae bacterium]
RGQGAGALLRSRSWRLLLPLAFGMAVVVPYQPYAQGVANGHIAPGFGAFLLRYFSGGPWPAAAFDGADVGMTWNHLWYLPYLWLYTAVLVVSMPLLGSGQGQRVRQAFLNLRGARLFVLPVLPLALYSLLLWPHFPPSHDLIHDGWLHAVYLTLFLYGWWIGTDAGWWAEATRLRWAALGAAAGLLALHFGMRAAAQGLEMPGLRMPARLAADLYLWAALLAILGWAHLKLNRPWRWLPWAHESVYPWYVLHQTLIIAGAVWLAPLALGPVVEPVLLAGSTVLGCWLLTAPIRRIGWLRPLFGLKPKAPRQCPSPGRPALPAGRSA